jgi:hypothetical protein
MPAVTKRSQRTANTWSGVAAERAPSISQSAIGLMAATSRDIGMYGLSGELPHYVLPIIHDTGEWRAQLPRDRRCTADDASRYDQDRLSAK